ncbi:MAG TPA: hypothetical protein VM121_03475 [Acidimicrobiales bacterium]|nr:hypothetical protein [Acidimicrobiales bacterium]
MTPAQEYLLPMEQSFLVRFHEWSKVLGYPKPSRWFKATLAFWHINRGLALAATRDVEGARSELLASDEVLKSDDLPRLGDARYEFQNNPASALVELDQDLLRGRVAEASGDNAAADASYRSALGRFDALYYDEPPPFYYPARETYGAFLLRTGRPQDAEAVFRADLVSFPNNGRSLFGLWKSLDAQQKPSGDIRAQSDSAWRWADTPLTIDSLG